MPGGESFDEFFERAQRALAAVSGRENGRVLVCGQDSGQGAWTGELYSPPYLFRGARPVIDAAPTNVVNGQTFSIESSRS